jgi:hypothetical protein
LTFKLAPAQRKHGEREKRKGKSQKPRRRANVKGKRPKPEEDSNLAFLFDL